MAAPAPRRSARIAAMAEAPPAPVKKPAPIKKPFWCTEDAKRKAYADKITAKYMALTPEQKAAEFKKQTAVIATAKQIAVDITDPAIPRMTADERNVVVKAIIERINDLWHEAMGCIDSSDEVMFITDAMHYAQIVIGEREPYMLEGYDIDYDDDFNEIPVSKEQHYRMYCGDVAKSIENFLHGFSTTHPHTVIHP
jgi:hypothetical protein